MAAPQPRYLGRNLCSLHFQLAESFQEFQVSTQHFDSTAAEEVQGCRSWYLYGQLRHGAGMEEAFWNTAIHTASAAFPNMQHGSITSNLAPDLRSYPEPEALLSLHSHVPSTHLLAGSAFTARPGACQAALRGRAGPPAGRSAAHLAPTMGKLLTTARPLPSDRCSLQAGIVTPSLHHHYTIAETTTTESLLKTVRKISLSFFLITSCTWKHKYVQFGFKPSRVSLE